MIIPQFKEYSSNPNIIALFENFSKIFMIKNGLLADCRKAFI